MGPAVGGESNGHHVLSAEHFNLATTSNASGVPEQHYFEQYRRVTGWVPDVFVLAAMVK